MAITPEEDLILAQRARTLGVVIAVTMIGWLGLQWVGSKLGWETRFVFLFDLAAIAVFIWALFVALQIWRKRREG